MSAASRRILANMEKKQKSVEPTVGAIKDGKLTVDNVVQIDLSDNREKALDNIAANSRNARQGL